MTKTAIIDAQYLHAALNAVDKDESRYHLSGVLVELREDSITYVATNGHILLAIHNNAPEQDGDKLIGDFTLPVDVIKSIKLKRHEALWAKLEKEDDAPELKLVYGDHTLTFKPIDGGFPDWRAVVPATFDPSERFMGYDPKYLTRLWKAGDILGSGPTLIPNGTGPAMVRYAVADAFGLIMPKRTEYDVKKTDSPEWARYPKVSTKAA
jgi:hypothetical protein